MLRNTFLPGNKYPPYLLYFVTSKCNMNCSHCFYWRDLNSDKQELGLDEVEKISKSLPNLFFLRITGGEPFLRDDLEQIVEKFYYHSSVRRIGISTNGLQREKILKFADSITAKFPDLNIEIGISIDHLREKHDSIRGCPGAFNSAMNTYAGLASIRERKPNLRLGFLITMMKNNQEDLEDIYKHLIKLNPDNIGLNIIRGKPNDFSQVNIDIKKYDDFRHLINKYNFHTSGRKSFIEQMRLAKSILSQDAIISMFKNKRSQFNCLASDRIAVLYADGNVHACELRNDCVGNIRDYACDFQRLWKSHHRKKIADGIKRENCFCSHECFITANLIFSLKNMFRIFLKALFHRGLFNNKNNHFVNR